MLSLNDQLFPPFFDRPRKTTLETTLDGCRCHKILCPSISASADCSEQRKCIHYANGSLTVLIAVYSVDEWF